MKAILEWPTPKSETKVRSFHGLANFYRKFIRYFSNIFGPLTKKMRRDMIECKWTIGADKSFNILKQKLLSSLF